MPAKISSGANIGRALITGGSGFIGSNLVDRLLAQGAEVVAFDNFSAGRRKFLESATDDPRFTLIDGDMLDQEALAAAAVGCDVVFHLAANADVKHGLEDPVRDLKQNAIATSNVLEAMRVAEVKKIVFSSTGSIYGEPKVFPTPETCPFPIQTSLYGASKLAGEGLISAYCNGYGFNGVILRFVSVLGERYTHGHVYDFYKRLKADPTTLHVLGDGNQRKSYVYVQDCIDAILLAHDSLQSGVEIFNMGLDETVIVNQSIEIICGYLNVEPEIIYSGGKRGWVGDSPLIHLDCSKLRSLGWGPKVGIEAAIGKTLEWFDQNQWVFD